ncbi:MAG: serine hydrolase [Balneolales bacterium]
MKFTSHFPIRFFSVSFCATAYGGFVLPCMAGLFLISCSVDTQEKLSDPGKDSSEDIQNEIVPEEVQENSQVDDEQDQQVEVIQPEDTLYAEIYELYREYDTEDAPGCVVAVYRNGKTRYHGAFGMANLDYGIPLSDSSTFYMASVSKQVTAAAAGLLIVRGELNREAKVSGYLEDWPAWAEEVRVKHLFNHTSGLPDLYDLMEIAGISLSNVMNLDDYVSVIKNGESLKHTAGSRFSFTNSGYTILAKLVEVVSGDDFSVFVEKELLKPLGMAATHFHNDRYRVIPNRVISYAPTESGSAFRQTYRSNFQGVGPGGLYSSLRDWRHWEAFWSGHYDFQDSTSRRKKTGTGLQEGSREQQWKMNDREETSPDKQDALRNRSEDFQHLRQIMTERTVVNGDTIDYGMGLQLETWQGVSMQGYFGSFMGFKTDVRRFPEHGLAVVTLCNREDADPGDKNRSIARLLLRERFESYLSPYSGTYYNEELQVEYTLTVENGGLKLHRRLHPNGFMTEDAHDKWSISSWEFVFQRDDTGGIQGFVVSTGRAREVEFLRK